MPTLLTGLGYIGAALLRRLVDQRDAAPIVALDNGFSTPWSDVEAAVPRGVRLVEGDVADPAAVVRAFDCLASERAAPDAGDAPLTVFHLAAQPSAAVAARDPEITERSNLVGARVLLEAAQQRGAHVIFGGSCRVYGDELVGQTISEDTPYGRVADLSHLSKIYVEQLARMIGLSFVSVRLGVTYGQSPIMKVTPPFMTVPNLFCQRAAQGDVLHVLEDRPLAFIHVDDAVDALLLAAGRSRRLNATSDIVNAAPEVATIGQLARTVQRIGQQRGAWVRIQGAASSEATYTMTSRLTADGFRPRRTLAAGLVEVLDFFLARRR